MKPIKILLLVRIFGKVSSISRYWLKREPHLQMTYDLRLFKMVETAKEAWGEIIKANELSEDKNE
jgi:hypothetical protein